MNINIMKCKLVRESTINYGEVCSPKDAVDLLKMIGVQDEPEEVFYVLCFAANGRCIGVHEVSRGQLGMAAVHPREVFKRVLLNNAYSMIIAHNHPSGNTNPSPADRLLNERLMKTSELMGIKLLDSIIITEDDHYSFKENEPELFYNQNND